MGAGAEDRALAEGGRSGGSKPEVSNWSFKIRYTPNLAALRKAFGEAAKEISNLRPAWYRLAPKMLRGIQNIIASKGSLLGQPWPGLKNKYYLARKARKGWSRAELFASYRLSQSIGMVSATSRVLKIGTSVPYARAVQWGKGGGNISSGGYNARFFIGVSDEMRAEAEEELNAHVNAGLGRLASKLNQKEAA